MAYKFPENKVKFLVKKLQKLKSLYRENKIDRTTYERERNRYANELYPIVRELAEVIINMKILRKFRKGAKKHSDDLDPFFDELITECVEDVFRLIDTADPSKQLFSYFSKIINIRGKLFLQEHDYLNKVDIDTVIEEDNGDELSDNAFLSKHSYTKWLEENRNAELSEEEQLFDKLIRSIDTQDIVLLFNYIFRLASKQIPLLEQKYNLATLQRIHILNAMMLNYSHFIYDILEEYKNNRRRRKHFKTEQGKPFIKLIFDGLIEKVRSTEAQFFNNTKIGKIAIDIYINEIVFPILDQISPEIIKEFTEVNSVD